MKFYSREELENYLSENINNVDNLNLDCFIDELSGLILEFDMNDNSINLDSSYDIDMYYLYYRLLSINEISSFEEFNELTTKYSKKNMESKLNLFIENFF